MKIKIMSKTCLNSHWIAKFLAKKNQECCECPKCKVKVKDKYNNIYIIEEYKV